MMNEDDILKEAVELAENGTEAERYEAEQVITALTGEGDGQVDYDIR